MAREKKIEVFSAGCPICQETIAVVQGLAGSSHEVVIHDMHQPETASKAKERGVRGIPGVLMDGKLAGCCVDRGPNIHVLRAALA